MAQRITDSGFKDWTEERLPNLKGKVYLITGGNSGIGFEAAKMLGEAGASLIIAARNQEKGERAVAKLNETVSGKVHLVSLDLADRASIESCDKQVREITTKLDGLINNAGLMQTPEQKTEDGFEMQFGVNHLGHFLLNGLLFDLVEKASGRIVVVSSIAHKYGRIHWLDPMMDKDYDPSKAYCQSKLANLMYALELNRRLKAADTGVTAYACHPGYSKTSLQSTGPTGFFNLLYKVLNPVMGQDPKQGALPTVLCAAGKEARPGGYYGPQNFREMRGPVSDALVEEKALKKDRQKQLWEMSEELVGFQWDKVLKASKSKK